MFLRNVTALTLSPPRIKETNLRIDEGEITEEGKFLRPRRDEDVMDLNGRIVMPGFVNAHTHLYSSLSRGMPAPRPAPKNFVEILEKVWWPLDESLDRETVYLSALAGAIESVKLGTTTIIDHHASPNHIIGSLDLIEKAAAAVGLRGILCYETTDRGGPKRRTQGLEENSRFVAAHVRNSHFRGMIGAHASFTLDDKTLRALGDLEQKHNAGIHIHVA
jgi:cytosine/adenosine deaminase-related metal-dependent hydrolase